MYTNSAPVTGYPTRRWSRVVRLDDIYEKEKGTLVKRIHNDPVSFVHRWHENADREVAGFIASQFAYGRIDIFMGFLERLFALMKEGPQRFVENGSPDDLRGLYYRFQKEDDLVLLFDVLRRIAKDHGSIGAMFRNFYKGDIRRAIWRIREEYLPNDGRLTFFFPRPSSAGAQKRWNMYLRWMVRKDEIDVGIWDFIDPGDLIMPLDTHIYKVGRCLGWITRKTPSYKAAQEVTEALKKFCPSDPLKYDFFLCHGIGIGAGCKGKRTNLCREKCAVYEI